jgi:HEAT repeat protein
MSSKLLLKVFPVVLLTVVHVGGIVGVARSQRISQSPASWGDGTRMESSKPVDINSLIQQLKSEDSKTRSTAASELGNMGASARSAIPSLIPLLKDSDAQVRSTAAYALGQMGKLAKSAIPSLIPLLKDLDYDARFGAVVFVAAYALGQMGELAIPSLMPLLKDSDAKVRSAALHAFGHMGESAKSAIPRAC